MSKGPFALGELQAAALEPCWALRDLVQGSWIFEVDLRTSLVLYSPSYPIHANINHACSENMPGSLANTHPARRCHETEYGNKYILQLIKGGTRTWTESHQGRVSCFGFYNTYASLYVVSMEKEPLIPQLQT